MPRRGKRVVSDSNEDTLSVGQVREKNPAAVALGRLGGIKGGTSRAAKLSASRRSEIAKIAAHKRWHGKDETEEEKPKRK